MWRHSLRAVINKLLDALGLSDGLTQLDPDGFKGLTQALLLRGKGLLTGFAGVEEVCHATLSARASDLDRTVEVSHLGRLKMIQQQLQIRRAAKGVGAELVDRANADRHLALPYPEFDRREGF